MARGDVQIVQNNGSVQVIVTGEIAERLNRFSEEQGIPIEEAFEMAVNAYWDDHPEMHP